MFWNVTGLKQKYFGNTHSSHIFLDYVSKFSIFGLAETWATKNDNFDIQGYKSFCAVRKQNRNCAKNSGGVVIYVRDELASISKVIKSSSNNVVWVLLQLEKRGFDYNLIVGNIYMSPEFSSIHSEEDTFNILENEICNFRNQYQSAKLLLMGDFNSYTSTQPDYVVDSSGRYDGFHNDDKPPEPQNRANKDLRNPNNYGRSLLNLCIMSNMYIVNGRVGDDILGECTCYAGENPSTIDYFLADKELFTCFKNFFVDCRDESHHMPLCLAASFSVQSLGDDNQDEPIVKNLPRYKWVEEKRASFLNCFTGKNLDNINECIELNDLDSAVCCFHNYLSESACDMRTNRVTQGRRSQTKNEEWFDGECSDLRRNNIRALREYRKYRNKTNLLLFKEGKKKLIYVYKEKKKIYQAHQRDNFKNLIETKDSKTFWSTLKRIQGRKGMLSTNISCQQWYYHFKRLFNPPIQKTSNYMRNCEYAIVVEQIDNRITEDEVIRAINGLKSGKAPGIDGIPAEFYKALIPYGTTVINRLFNKIYDLAYFPETWRESLIITIHKKGQVNNPDNYRGISLLNVLSKAFTTILNTRISRWLEQDSTLCKEQGGFRRKFSTIDSIFILETLIEKYIGKPRGRLYCAFVDFTKAFDTINREALWLKLQNIGISSKMLNMLMSIYSKVEASVLTQRGQSQTFFCPMGVKQGCILSPTLFSAYVNDLPTFFANEGTHQIPLVDLELSSMLYADDLVLISESSIGLQRQLNLLKNYCDKWQLKVNQEKTKVMVFRRGGALRRYEKWYYDGIQLDTCTYFSYLGVNFSSLHHWGYNQRFRASKGLKAMGSLNRLLHTMPSISSDTVWKVFDTQILPILHYSS